MTALQDIVERLRSHFIALGDARRVEAPGAPVFGIEHPLETAEVLELARTLRESLKRERRVNLDYSIGWVVLAAECGYGFGGSEFWPTLEQRIPEWSWSGDRHALRNAFGRFVDDFGGRKPTGRWASHFCLIAWPITHAILPRDLQRHLCEAIYEARYQLWGMRGLDLPGLGKIIARAAPIHGTRFDDFIHDHALVGAIVHRLLVDDSDAKAYFFEKTFQRILKDLHITAAAQEWLSEASCIYSRGVSVSVPRTSTAGTLSDTRTRTPSLIPDLQLIGSDNDGWSPRLAPPSLADWTQHHPDVVHELDTLKFRIDGVNDRAFPAQALLASRPASVTLEVLPRLDTPLIEFVPQHAGLSAAFDADCRIKERSVLAFRQSGDVAYLVAKGELLPGESYIFATRNSAWTIGKSLSCPDPTWRLWRWEVPSSLDPPISSLLQASGLSIRRTTRLRPWGFVPRRWDYDTDGEWLITEPIVFVIERDHVFDAISISIDGSTPRILECDGMEDPTIVLDDLHAGSYPLTVATFERRTTRTGTEWIELGRCEVPLRVRAPVAWSPGRVAVDALRIDCNPPRPSLAQLLKEEVVVTVDGLATAPVEVSLICVDGPGKAAAPPEVLIRQRAPIRAESWLAGLTALQRRIHPARILMGAQRSYLRVFCEPLGEQRIALSLVSSPVRWVLRGESVRLICDGNKEPEVAHASFEEPSKMQSVDRVRCQRGLDAMASGLFVAREEAFIRGVIVGQQIGSGIASLRASVRVDDLRGVTVLTLVAAYRQWESAIATTTFAKLSQDNVLKLLHQELLSRYVSGVWKRLEKKRFWPDLEEEVDRPDAIHSFGYTLGKQRGQRLAQDALQAFFVQASLDYKVTPDRALIDSAWNLAAQPCALADDWNGPPPADTVAFARLLRGARLLCLGNDIEKETSA